MAMKKIEEENSDNIQPITMPGVPFPFPGLSLWIQTP
jgi:hypothetical protein